MEPKSDPVQTTRGVAALAVCIVQTLRESDPSFPERLLARCEEMHRTLTVRGDSEAADFLFVLARSLRDETLFPSRDS
jgi:hypothetical protein